MGTVPRSIGKVWFMGSIPRVMNHIRNPPLIHGGQSHTNPNHQGSCSNAPALADLGLNLQPNFGRGLLAQRVCSLFKDHFKRLSMYGFFTHAYAVLPWSWVEVEFWQAKSDGLWHIGISKCFPGSQAWLRSLYGSILQWHIN